MHIRLHTFYVLEQGIVNVMTIILLKSIMFLHDTEKRCRYCSSEWGYRNKVCIITFRTSNPRLVSPSKINELFYITSLNLVKVRIRTSTTYTLILIDSQQRNKHFKLNKSDPRIKFRQDEN